MIVNYVNDVVVVSVENSKKLLLLTFRMRKYTNKNERKDNAKSLAELWPKKNPNTLGIHIMGKIEKKRLFVKEIMAKLMAHLRKCAFRCVEKFIHSLPSTYI